MPLPTALHTALFKSICAPLRLVRPAHQASLEKPGNGALRFVAMALLALAAATAQIAFAQIAPGTTGIDNTGNPVSELTACNNGTTQQARDTCMTEVRNANSDKRAGKLGADANLSTNALMRCNVFQKADDQAACKARVLGEQNAQGGIAAGGVLRESETALPAPEIGSLPAKP